MSCTRATLLAIVITLALLLLPTHADAQEGLAPFLGSWAVDLQMGPGSGSSSITFALSEAGELGGTWTDETGESTLQEVRYEDGAITFKRTMGGGRRPGGGGRGAGGGPRGGLTVTVRIEDGTLKGTLTTPRGEREFEGKRIDG